MITCVQLSKYIHHMCIIHRYINMQAHHTGMQTNTHWYTWAHITQTYVITHMCTCTRAQVTYCRHAHVHTGDHCEEGRNLAWIQLLKVKMCLTFNCCNPSPALCVYDGHPRRFANPLQLQLAKCDLSESIEHHPMLPSHGPYMQSRWVRWIVTWHHTSSFAGWSW